MHDAHDVEAVRTLLAAPPDQAVAIPGTGRIVAADIDGDASGLPVVLVHGTPDSRLARHPDRSIAEELGVRLICVDRPGFGHSTANPAATPRNFAQDLTVLLDALQVDSAHVLSWSAGTIWSLGAARYVPERVRSVTAVGGLVPLEAFDDAAVTAAAGPARVGMIETARDLGAAAAAEMIAPMLVPDPITPVAALEHRAETDESDLAAVPGADIRMAAAVCDAVRSGVDGLIRDVTVQFTDSGVDLAGMRVPTRLVTGSRDATCPPAFAHWYARRIPNGAAEIVPNAGHGLLLTHWRDILSGITRSTGSLTPR